MLIVLKLVSDGVHPITMFLMHMLWTCNLHVTQLFIVYEKWVGVVQMNQRGTGFNQRLAIFPVVIFIVLAFFLWNIKQEIK